MDESRQIVVTGAGVVCPIGIGKQTYWEALLNRTSGVRPITAVDARHRRVRIGGEVVDFNPKLYVEPRKSIKVMCREIQIGFAAANLAMQDAGLDSHALDPNRFGVIFGSEMLYGELEELEEIYRASIENGEFRMERFASSIETTLYPLWMLKHLPNMAACHIGIAYDARGPNNSIVQGDVSSLLAVIEAVHVIRRGHADVMLVGGLGSRLSITPVTYRSDENLSHRNDQPQQASRPFELHRDGMVNGEGGGAILLESVEHARRRNANMLAIVSGVGQAYCGHFRSDHLPTRGIVQSIRQALELAELTADDICHVNAHGLGTLEHDRWEAAAISDTLGAVRVTAPKSYFGNLGAGGGLVELISSLSALEMGVVPPTLNYETPDPGCPVNVVREAQPSTKPHALILNQSTMGQAAAVVLSKAG